MQLKTPFKTVQDNLMVTQTGEVWAYYRTEPVPISEQDEEAIERHKSDWQSVFMELARYKDFHLELYPKQIELDKRLMELQKDFDRATHRMGTYYNEETTRMLAKEFGVITEESFVIGVCLKQQLLTNSSDVKGMLQHVFTSVTDRLVSFLGMESEIAPEYFARFKDVEKELARMLSLVGAIPLTEDELIYINRFHFLRGIGHVVEEEKEKRGVTNITDSILDPTEPGFLKLQTTQGESYLSFVVIDNFPLNMANAHIYLRSQNLHFPFELHIKGSYPSVEMTKGKVHRTEIRFKQTQKEQHAIGNNSSDRIKQGRYVLDRLKNHLDNDIPFINWVASFVVYGKTKEECRKHANTLIRVMKRQKIDCVRPIADQLQLFYKFLHGKALDFEKSWVQRTTPEGIAEVAFSVSTRLGSNVGFYIGRVDQTHKAPDTETAIYSSRKMVLFHPFLANKGIRGAKTDSPHIAITGETGKGKSFLTKLIFVYLTFLKCKVLYIDPKSEIQKWFTRVTEEPYYQEHYPLFVRHLQSFNYVTLDKDNPDNWGVLDPIIFLEGADAKDTAQSVIEQIYNLNNKDEVKTAVLREIDHVIERRQSGEKVGLLHVIWRLRESEEKAIQAAGELLHQLTQNSVLQLVFSDGSNPGLNLKEKVNVLQVAGLDLPKESDDPMYYSDAERKSLCLMIPLAKYTEKFGSSNPDEETAEIFDEAWILTSARGGKKLTKSMRRIGRSYNNALIYVTQSVSDVHSEDDHGNFGVVFAFDEPAEREDILKHMGMEVSEENKAMLADMIKGQCLMRDIYGRTGKIVVHCPFEEMREAFKTVERNHSAAAEEAFAF
ncbi:ATP-binding protein [Paenibacillus larvae]|uniref:Type-IV secretion system protein TraC n=1 Tax=Paenibacillus larvae subsp. larvae TaxID=147375 RepID=A0A6C0QXN5_9BACL|nr:ATP-binding protein [Paenibacillus larvae]QHZ53350.1 type-IV secretion system protein TraC [Paenibacillus larvae subsp. larvae]